jgi:hypothetical protein
MLYIHYYTPYSTFPFASLPPYVYCMPVVYCTMKAVRSYRQCHLCTLYTMCTITFMTFQHIPNFHIDSSLTYIKPHYRISLSFCTAQYSCPTFHINNSPYKLYHVNMYPMTCIVVPLVSPSFPEEIPPFIDLYLQYCSATPICTYRLIRSQNSRVPPRVHISPYDITSPQLCREGGGQVLLWRGLGPYWRGLGPNWRGLGPN